MILLLDGEVKDLFLKEHNHLTIKPFNHLLTSSIA